MEGRLVHKGEASEVVDSSDVHRFQRLVTVPEGTVSGTIHDNVRALPNSSRGRLRQTEI